ncbi:DNA adenine methylase [Lentilactobacillus parabuchneri]|uniref:DNA adenine methylase n=1 Tax=Lentilactobacillus parabuchneri TaxID=152331 RepID=UPI0007F95C23|nr:DNA adenine methylase [Lentilactobacillus parabuchneri]OBU97863.1 DNA adenine methylase [Lentilactobacillus parabuchneri]
MPKTDSPFRYPGGKTQLYQFVSNLLNINKINGTYIEPFAGGAGVAIKLLLENKVSDIWINDYDKAIYSVWHAILNNPNQLIEKINGVPFDYQNGYTVSPEESLRYWKHQRKIYLLENNHQNSVELAFSTLFLNRTNVSGIINAGPLGGFDQSRKTKIYDRFNKQTLIDKINCINSKSKHIKLTRLNGLDMLSKINYEIPSNNCFIFFDPPYYEQGKNLYYSSFNDREHRDLAKQIMKLSNYRWIVTYDESPQIFDMYTKNKHNYEYQLRYSANNKKRGKAPEFLFASPSLNIESYDQVHLQEK